MIQRRGSGESFSAVPQQNTQATPLIGSDVEYFESNTTRAVTDKFATGIIGFTVVSVGIYAGLLTHNFIQQSHWEPKTVLDIASQVVVCTIIVACTVVGKYCLMINATKQQAFEIANLLPNYKFIMGKISSCGTQQVKDTVLSTINWGTSLVAAGTWGYFGGIGNIQIAEFLDTLGGKWGDLATMFRHPAAIALVGGSTFVGNLLLLPILQKIATKGFLEIVGRFYQPFEAQKKQLVELANANIYLKENINREFQHLITLLKSDADNTNAIQQSIDRIGNAFSDMLPREDGGREVDLQRIIEEFKNLDDVALRDLILQNAVNTADVTDGAPLLYSEIASGILGLSIAIFASVGYIGLFDIAGQMGEFLKIPSGGATKAIQTIAFISTAIPIFALVYEYGFLVIRHLTDSPLIKSNIDFLSNRSKVFIAFCGAVLCGIGTAPLVFLALMEHLPLLMSAFFTPVGAWFLEIKNTINLITAHFEEKEKNKALKKLDSRSTNPSNDLVSEQPNMPDESDILTSKIIGELHQLLSRLNSVYDK